ncbi:MAG: hypothetical protein M0Z60_08235 [Nitrospiraceae bacterium]|nr:hypothetical protein [Nitrospiraceae bacterium]
MEKRLRKAFNEDVEKYRRILLSCANKSDWETFKMNAGRLFDYIESIEISEIERRFYRISWVIIGALFFSVIVIVSMNFDLREEIIRLRKLMGLAALMGGSFQLYFYLNFLWYLEQKNAHYERRRERFISNIEKDFSSP